MNHDYAHCLDFKKTCPKKCFRAKLVRDLQQREDLICVPLSWVHFRETKQCPKNKKVKNDVVECMRLDITESEGKKNDKIY